MIEIAVTDYRRHRAEDFLLRRRVGIIRQIEQCRLEEIAFGQMIWPLAACNHPPAMGNSLGGEMRTARALGCADNRACLGGGIVRRADFELGKHRRRSLQHLRLALLRHEQPRAQCAALSGMGNGNHHCLHGCAINRIRQEYLRRFSAQFQHDFFHCRRGLFKHFDANRAGAGEADHIDARIGGHHSAALKPAFNDDVEHARWQSGLLCRFSKKHGR